MKPHANQPGRGRGGGGRGRTTRKNLITAHARNLQQEKKQKVHENQPDDWEEMDDNRKSLSEMMQEDDQEMDLENKSTEPSVGTIGDKSFNSFDDHVCNQGGQCLIMQASTKLGKEMLENDDDEIFEDIAGASAKFIVKWLSKQLITGVVHNECDIIIDDVCGFRSWVQDFRIVGKSRRHAQIYFQAHSQVP